MQYSDQLLQAIENYLNGNATAAEQQVVNDWYRSFDDAEVSVDVNDAAYEKLVDARLKLRIHNSTGIAVKDVKTIKLWPRIAVAAAAVATITLGVWLYNISNTPRHPEFSSGSPLANDIAPGKNTATLTLADGKTILLDTNRTSVVVTDSVKTMTMLTASTPRGGTYQVTLPDGTKVWLNADSKISFPSQFNGKERKILLEGEAYFEVAKVYTSSRQNAMPSSRQSAATRDLMPFIVESAGQQVQVLGTHFNINSYADEGVTKTTLLEGSVDVNGSILKPSQQAVLTGNKQISVREVDVSEAVAWKNNEFMFESQTIEQVMRMVARWYNVEVIYEGQKPVKKFSGGVSRFDNLSKLLQILEGTGGAHFRIEDRKIYVSD